MDSRIRNLGRACVARLEQFARDREGASMVEFALVAPIFFFMVFGFIQLALWAAGYALSEYAIREGCRTFVTYYQPAPRWWHDHQGSIVPRSRPEEIEWVTFGVAEAAAMLETTELIELTRIGKIVLVPEVDALLPPDVRQQLDDIPTFSQIPQSIRQFIPDEILDMMDTIDGYINIIKDPDQLLNDLPDVDGLPVFWLEHDIEDDMDSEDFGSEGDREVVGWVTVRYESLAWPFTRFKRTHKCRERLERFYTY